MARRKPTPTVIDVECETPYLWREFKRMLIVFNGQIGSIRDDGAIALPDLPERCVARCGVTFNEVLQSCKGRIVQ